MMDTLQGMKRTHYCGELTEGNIGEVVTVMGWADVYRNLGSLIFIDLRDRSGIIQLSFDTDIDAQIFEKAATIRTEYVLAVTGEVVKRSSPNPKLPTGMIEIKVTELRILNKAETTPFEIKAETDVKDELRLKYRYLDLRRAPMQKNLILRHKLANIARNFYDENGFIEIETPMLTRSTPEGARDYLVPSRVHPGSFYALPQSPQQYKQLLMVSGMDRYFQIVKCFRDEDLRADRQPEFTQIDLEMSFVEIDDVISVNERMIARVFKEILDIDVPVPFKRMTYKEAMERFGSDKPDTRFGLELNNISDLVKDCGFGVFKGAVEAGGSVRAIKVDGGATAFSRKDLDALGEFVKTYRAKGLAWLVCEEGGTYRSPIAKFFEETELKAICDRVGAKAGDTVLFVADQDNIVFDALGALRCEIAKRLNLTSKDQFNLLWVTEFPLLEYSEEEDRYVAKHHPFTSPMDEDIDLLSTRPQDVRAKAYDIILNGCELGGGSIRIFNTELQQKMFEVLGFTKEEAWARFGYLLEAFKYGTPPHGGMAYGLDRFVMLLTGADSIREVIAFPKVQNASELMTNAPAEVDDKQLAELSIKTQIATQE
ncbi:MAG: aspartate--tRNA ligase [Clostridia bacterium]|nr:aspartate--tRNA ligase [Clostridia bacterium]